MLSATIDHFVRVTIVPRADRQVVVRSLDLGRMVGYDLDEGPDYDGVMDLAKAAIARVGVPTGIDVGIASEAPAGSGLGGSSALVTAVVAGLAQLQDHRYTPEELACLSYAIERDDLGISGGWQDQYMAAWGGLNLLEFSSEGVRVTPVQIRQTTMATLQDRLLLCYTGSVRRDAGLIEEQIALHGRGREDTLLGMKQLQEMAYSMREALEGGDPDRVGVMLRDAFEAKKRMNPGITRGTSIDAMLDLARSSGATGGKVCGAGGGGYLLLYCPPDAQPRIRQALEAAGGQFAPFTFWPEGVRARRAESVWAPR